ncbi:MAG: hypothetical protein MJB57_10125 [Gemmatimonadetes bacterium]|nr:hypothetical protein [Gemmatimonadota bacterium]
MARSSIAYAVVTLAVAAVAVIMIGGSSERIAGVVLAWAIQVTAFARLRRALDAGADASREWLGGIVVRAMGLAACGGLALVGWVTKDLPAAYGLSMLVLLLAEAGWLIPAVVGRAARRDGHRNRTHETG